LIRHEEVSSRDVTTADTKKLEKLSYRENTIDLILCVDMLNMGYHVSDISGIVMYRATGSDIIYPQQYGRVLASGSLKDHVVFDIADNLHRKLKLQAKQKPHAQFPSVSKKPIDSATPGDANSPEDHPVEIHYDGPECFPGSTPPFSESHPEEPDEPERKWYNHTSDLLPCDLKLAACTATYREQIAKLVAEPMQIRCKEAFEAHFKRWCIANGYKYPVTNAELKSLYNTDKQAFISYFENLIKEHKLDYPMRDAAKLLEIGKARPDGLPMEVFAKW